MGTLIESVADLDAASEKLKEKPSVDPFDLMGLPTEIILKIINYLELRDILSVRQTCHRCHAISLKSSITSKICLKFKEVDVFSDEQEQIICSSEARYLHLRLSRAPLRNLNLLCTTFGTGLKSLSLYNMLVQDNQLELLFSHLINLEELSLIRITLFKIVGSWKYPNLKSITLQEANNELFKAFFTGQFSRLEYIDVDTQGSLNIDEIQHEDIYNLLLKNCKHLKDIKLYKWISRLTITELAEVFSHIHLKKLYISGSLENDVIDTVLRSQMYLTDISISGYIRRTEGHFIHCLDYISKTFASLDTINLSHCSIVRFDGLKLISDLNNLTCLDLSQCYNLESGGIVNGFALRPNLNLKELNMSCLPRIDSHSLIHCTLKFPNLKSLNISGNSGSVKNHVVQAICQNLLHLECLDISECRMVDDEGITGREKSGNVIGVSIQCLTKLKELDLSYTMVSNIGIAELNLSHLKKFRLCYNGNISTKGIETLCLNCPQIEELQLNACPKVNDNTLKVINNHLTHLVDLELNYCPKLSYNAVRRIKKRNLKTCIVFGVNAVSPQFINSNWDAHDYEHALMFFNNNN